MFQEFKTFLARGNVMDLAVGVIIGGAFATITKSLTEDLIMPVVGWLFGGFDFSSYFVMLADPPASYRGSLTDYAALKAAGVPLFGYGAFVTAVINFVILAFMIFLLIRFVNRLTAQPKPVETAPAPEAEDVKLLREIRDALTARPAPARKPAAPKE
jgi:large conductance mechanosensitive channel